MKWLIIAIIVFAQQPTEAPSHKRAAEANSAGSARQTKSTQDNQTQPAQPTPAAPQTPIAPEGQRSAATANDHTQQGNKQASDEDRATQRELTWFTGVLATVGVFQLVVMFLTWTVYRRQAREMRRQRHEMRGQRHIMFRQWKAMGGQAGLMENQLKEMQKQAALMENQLEEMRASTDAFINKDRGRVRISVENPQFLFGPENFNIGFMLSSSGETKVFVDDFRAMFIKTKDADIVPNYAECTQIRSGGREIPEADCAAHDVIGLRPDRTLTYEDRENIKQGKLFLHFCGFVRFRDIFERRRRQNIHLRWSDTGRPEREDISEWYWKAVGTPEENGEAEEKGQKAN